MSFNTGNPVPSTDSRDLSDNAENFDSAVNSQLDVWSDRLGVSRDTVAGRINKMGYEVPVAYAGGISFLVNDNVKTVSESGVVYAPFPDELPFTTTGTWGVIGVSGDNLKFFVVQAFLNFSSVRNIDTLTLAIGDTGLVEGDTIYLKERTAGNGGGGHWNVVLASTVTPNGKEIVQCTGIPTLALVMSDNVNLGPFQTVVGLGTVARQPNCAYQSNRDAVVDNGFSWHGFIVTDKFTIDGSALNCFGSDVVVGDGTHAAPFLIDHVNAFQTLDIIELGLGSMTSHAALTTFDQLRSGTVAARNGVNLNDLLGITTTPGLNIPNFEVNGAAQVNNQTGVRTTIKHGLNPKSAYFSAGTNDVGGALSTGGAPVDCECPIIVRQVTESVSPTTGAIAVVAGGIGATGNIVAGSQLRVNNVAPSLRLNSAAGTQLGIVYNDATTMFVLNSIGTDVKFGGSGTASLELKSDRLIPTVDNALFCGDGSHRYQQFFAVTDVIGTSDMTLKTSSGAIDDNFLDAWGEVQQQFYQWNDVIGKKGDDARIHAGFMAQEIEQALADKGIDGFKYGLLCKDELTEDVTRTRKASRQKIKLVPHEEISFVKNDKGLLIRTVESIEIEQPVMEDLQVFNADGTAYQVEDFEVKDRKSLKIMRDVIHQVPVMEDYDEEYTETVSTGEYRYGLRYSQCLVVESAYLRREIARLKANS